MGFGRLLLFCALILRVSANNPLWRKLEGDLEPEPVTNFLQLVDESYRLPVTSTPYHYNLQLSTAIHENNRQFQGVVEIFLNLLEVTDRITVHNRQLTISKMSLFRVSDQSEEQVLIGTPDFEMDNRTQHFVITSGQFLSVGNYVVKIEFSGVLQNNNNMGFFASSYLDDNGKRHYLASSKFEPTHARSAFPCYDEPKLKATFTLSMIHHKDYHAVSNMPQDGEVVADVDNPDYVKTTFKKSTPMSTYLLAFAVSNFRIRSKGIHTVYARPNMFEETEYPLNTGVDILNVLGEYTGVDYTKYMPKMTQIAIPDRGTGAMENWGLVAYGEPVLLFNPTINTYRNKKSVTTIIAHEFAHQWFGNLVTPLWWDYLWLSEGFATVYEYYAAQLAYPEDGYWDLWNVQVVHNALGVDTKEYTRPMTSNAASPSEIAGLFDTVAYGKAGSVLNMFRVAFQDDNWREGLLSYLMSNELDAITAQHLYEGLQTAVNGKNLFPKSLTVQQLMDSWTTEPGYPLLTVRRDYKNGIIYLSQERFFDDRQMPNDHVYHIPYNYATETKPDFSILEFEWLSSKGTKLSTSASSYEWIIFNKQQTGYYRVNYDLENWSLIIKALQRDPSAIHVQNRAQLINDAFNLARADRLDMALPLELLTYLKKEHEYPPWAAASSILTYFNNKLRGTPIHEHFLLFTEEILESVYVNLPIDTVPRNETLLQKYLKQSISTWACRIGKQDCMRRTEATLKQAVQRNTPVHPDIASVVYCYGLHSSGEPEFTWMYERLRVSRNQAERSLLIDSLGCSQSKPFLKALLTTAVGNSGAFNFLEIERTQIVSAVYSTNRVGVDVLIEFLMDDKQINDFIARLGQSVLNNAVTNIASRTNNVAENQLLEALLSKQENKISPSSVQSARTIVTEKVAWFNTLEGLVVEEFFVASSKKGSISYRE
ncbi:aminopeptidase N-like [Toxorhynchites rutilus septentrionalis]|uniref:aminopeptidase N-like n=1 Tax=Toxorhynchites rutilus septentrionalis TaxID=329112 RepID=UPI0024788586|nr:aminopeptidase N-like [Toxorhynchites rutilus septentrionalis]